MLPQLFSLHLASALSFIITCVMALPCPQVDINSSTPVHVFPRNTVRVSVMLIRQDDRHSFRPFHSFPLEVNDNLYLVIGANRYFRAKKTPSGWKGTGFRDTKDIGTAKVRIKHSLFIAIVQFSTLEKMRAAFEESGRLDAITGLQYIWRVVDRLHALSDSFKWVGEDDYKKVFWGLVELGANGAGGAVDQEEKEIYTALLSHKTLFSSQL
ncbi:hypothetical protein J3R30DRAFT_3470037 [Lentinula aciculospora]|uniref:Uncharacterized protein n=1 Tax=Lentinula aciculospora TaxID=153920 RepID=A0A9W9AEC4_9AGAR|nr:hypothetical protein J3R30DRAFT_3470037 [Lentinula aciculospora]